MLLNHLGHSISPLCWVPGGQVSHAVNQWLFLGLMVVVGTAGRSVAADDMPQPVGSLSFHYNGCKSKGFLKINAAM